MNRRDWLIRYGTSAKIGTIQMVVRLDGRQKIEVGRVIRFQELYNGPWHVGTITNADPLRIARR